MNTDNWNSVNKIKKQRHKISSRFDTTSLLRGNFLLYVLFIMWLKSWENNLGSNQSSKYWFQHFIVGSQLLYTPNDIKA